MSETADSKLSWSIVLVVVACFVIPAGVMAPLQVFGISSKDWFFIALAVGLVVAFGLNFVRARYGNSSGRLKRLYDFLLRQFPRPD